MWSIALLFSLFSSDLSSSKSFKIVSASQKQSKYFIMVYFYECELYLYHYRT